MDLHFWSLLTTWAYPSMCSCLFLVLSLLVPWTYHLLLNIPYHNSIIFLLKIWHVRAVELNSLNLSVDKSIPNWLEGCVCNPFYHAWFVATKFVICKKNLVHLIIFRSFPPHWTTIMIFKKLCCVIPTDEVLLLWWYHCLELIFIPIVTWRHLMHLTE